MTYRKEKLIITIALTGNVPTKEINPYTPITVDEIVEDIIKCRQAGASVAHIHVRDEKGEPTCDKNLYKEVLNKLKERDCDIITQLSTGARGGGNTAEWRGQMLDLNAEMASLSTGSSNFASQVNANSFELIKELAAKMYANNIKPEIEAFDLGMIDNAALLLKEGVLKEPLQFNLVMNVRGSVKGTPRNLLHMIESLPEGSTFTVSGIGYSQIPMLTMSILLGGHTRTGLEDTILYDRGLLATNQMLVERVMRIAKELGREIATPDEARKILGIK
ncbi:3-keto-5-aminohexanoate cleavage protein [Tissierella carlieri]|uniref:3-keto-5-aminohexanoate cleavage protein n=1 Tax=Tissierella carlieri TaxID=689904 RepID=A0ABT1SH24_9FIRM|nr:3-keto-5-aminohexanoate cleavage protein [Tissierella carlieri]MBU5313296.1 3-keto-5-aminohexanoate cleavage protein [Tissierella carlieri]MCQ4925232.1 3-keto-5-aminohexanoate cleavage protein [Tissierella carlieri]